MDPCDPETTVELVSRRISASDVEGALALYERDAAFTAAPGEVVTGQDAIRAALERFAALEPTLTGRVRKVVQAGDVALVLNDWTLEGRQPGGEPVRMGGTSADVLRRQPDGRRLVAIDDPWGAAASG